MKPKKGPPLTLLRPGLLPLVHEHACAKAKRKVLTIETERCPFCKLNRISTGADATP